MAKPASSKPPKASQDATQAKTPGKAAKGKSAGAGSKAKWSRENERDLIKFLVKIKSTAGDGASFKLPAFRAAATHLAKKPYEGPEKSARSCKNKWGRVRLLLLFSSNRSEHAL